ncbi:MAG TPA: MFS transporter [Pseudonocardiaceae bacterium]|jgi:MFS family permease|nr:MFS transporter [Pseudonocardiaceae bacterium]
MPTTTASPSVTIPMTRAQLTLSTVGCLVTLLLSLLDTNIVGAVSYPMVRDLDPVHGVAHLPLLVIGYTLADCVVLPSYGKLADNYGAKRIYLIALSIFIAGSALCGLSTSLVELIGFRTLQGIGGGGLISTTMVILGLIQRGSNERTGRQGTTTNGMGGVLIGVGMALGPTVGGVVAEHLGWRWAFYLNLPLAGAALVLAVTALRLPPVRAFSHRIDFLGAALIAGSASALLLVTEWGGKQYPWNSAPIIGLTAAGVVLLIAFFRRQARADEPIIPLALSGNPAFRTMAALSVFAGIGLTGSLVYLGLYNQLGRGLSVLQSGLWMLVLAAGFVAAPLASGAILARWGRYRNLLVLGNGLTALAMALFAMSTHTQDWQLWLGISLFALGFGLGQNVGIGITYAQKSVDIEHIGSATTALRFLQQLGAAFGAALMGAIMNQLLATRLTGPASAANSAGQLNTAIFGSLPAPQRHAVADAFMSSIGTLFVVSAVIMLIPFALAFFVRQPGAAS